MKRLIAGLAATLALSFTASLSHAQDAAPATPPDPVRLALAHQMIDAAGGQRQAEMTIRMVYSSMGQAMAKNLPPERSKMAALVVQDMQDELVKLMPQLLDAGAQVYAANLTEQEMRDYLTWATSESGRAFVQKTPVIAQQLVQAEMPAILAAIPGIVHKAVDHACDQAQCTPEQRDAVVAAATKAISRGS